MPYRIGEYLIDPEAYEIRRAGVRVPVEPQVFDLLVVLIEERQRAVSKDEIIERVWKGRIISDATLSSRIKAARQALGDDGSAQKLIRTIHGRGFRFVGEVTPVDPPAAAVGEPDVDSPPHRPDEGAAPASASRESIGPRIVGAVAAKPAVSRKWALRAAALITLVAAGFAADRLLLSGAAGPGTDETLTHPAPIRTQEDAAAFKDCDVCPEMVELPVGTFLMGSAEDEPGRQRVEGPPRPVIISHRVAVGRLEVTVDQFTIFVAETGMAVSSGCSRFDPERSRFLLTEGSFREPGFEQTGSHPAVCISWHEAQAYAAWLGRRTGKPYRLPSEAEWEYAARAGTTTSYSFGGDESQLCDYGRFADLGSQFPWRGGCRSDAKHGPIQVGTLKPNPWGLFDMHGNAWEWAADCWTSDPLQIPTDGSAFAREGACEVGFVRGGGWPAQYNRVRSAQRLSMTTTTRSYHVGFRVALTLGPP